jgi:hypothetical protein
MKALRNCEHLFAPGYDAGHTQGILVCLSARVNEEHTTHIVRGNAEQLFCGARTDIQRNGIALKNQLGALRTDRLSKTRVSVAECGDGMAAVQVEYATTVGRDDVAAGSS